MIDKLIISVPTKEDWEKVVQKLLDEGCVWCTNQNKLEECRDWDVGEKSVIYIQENELYRSNEVEKTREEYGDYKFLTAQEFLGEEREFRVGDKVECVKKYENVEIGVKGKIISISDDFLPIGVEWEKDINGHDCEGDCKNGYGYYVREKNIKLLKEDPKREGIITPEGNIPRWYLEETLQGGSLPILKDPKCEEINKPALRDYSYSESMDILMTDNLPHEGKIKKMEHYILRKLDKDKRILYKRGYYNEDLSLTEKGERLLNYILKDEYEKKMADIAREEKEEEE